MISAVVIGTNLKRRQVSPVLSIAGNITPLAVPVSLAVSASAVLSGCRLPQSKPLQGPCCHLNLHNLLHEAHSLHEVALNWRSQKLSPIVLLSSSLYLSHIFSNFCQLLSRNDVNALTSLAAADAVLQRLDQNRTEQRPQPGKWLTARTKPRIGEDECTSCTRSHQRHLNRFHVVPNCAKVTSDSCTPSLNQSSKYPGILITCPL